MRALLLVVLVGVLCAGCPSFPSRDAASGDAGLDAIGIDAPLAIDIIAARDASADSGTDAGPPSPLPSKGPWVLRPSATGVTVRWESRGQPPTVAVNFAPESGGAMQTTAGASRATIVTTGYGVGNPFVRVPDYPGLYFINEVTLDGLSPGTCYRYQVVDAPDSAGRFCTMHAPTDHTAPIRFMVIGDTNPSLGHTAGVLTNVLPMQPEFVVHLGDLQYYSSVVESWQSWFAQMAPLLRAGAFLPCIGNHEDELSGHEFIDYYGRLFAAPGIDGNTTRYHFATGGIHFFSLSSEDSLAMGSEQWNWLSSALDAASASAGFRFSVLYFHRPPYTLGDSSPRTDIRASLAPLVASHAVPLVLAGHMHGYERFDVSGVTYLVSAGGGGEIGDVNAGVSMNPGDVPLRVASGPYYHAVIITVMPGTFHAQVIDETGVTRDSWDQSVP